jgi:signal peptidase II
MNILARNRIYGLSFALAIFGIDRLVKWMLLGPLELREKGEIYLLPFFQFTFVENYGVSLGMLPAASTEMRLLLIAVLTLIALGVLVWLLRESKLWDILPLAAVLGGATGNIRDRWYFGYVVDYADLHFGNYRPFLIFNIADAAITIGVVIVLARSLFLREKRPEAGSGAEPETAEEAAETN